MLRLIAGVLALSFALLGAQTKLYLSDGTFHLVREYEVRDDRVRFYSTERRQWEEMPLDLVDLDRTRREIDEQRAVEQKEIEFWDREDQAERARMEEISRVPVNPGSYYLDKGIDEIRIMPQAELDVLTNKRQQLLKMVTPIPVVAGKKNVIIKGEHSEFIITDPQPEFYLRLFREERFAIIRLGQRKGNRTVEQWHVLPVTDEVVEQHGDIEIFRREVAGGLYKLWPKQPLEPGEYAVIEFSLGEANVQAWDFGYWPGGAPQQLPDTEVGGDEEQDKSEKKQKKQRQDK